MSGSDPAERVCGLITLQRGVVQMARLLDIALENGDEHERSFNSSSFLEHLNTAIKSESPDINRRFVLADSYIRDSYKRLFRMSLEFYAYISDDLVKKLEQARRRSAELESNHPTTHSREILRRAEEASTSLRVLRDSLSPTVNDFFTGQAEDGISLSHELLACCQAVQDQINVYSDRAHSLSQEREARNVNRRAVFWAIVGAIGGVIGTAIAVSTFDIEKAQALWKFILRL